MNIWFGIQLVLLAAAVLTFASGWIWNGALARDIRSVTLLVLTVFSASISLGHLFF
ncbi:hypothetical protein [Ochrobactrum soli]|uniref:Uncharacterized protein n=1 Tax=Ochrobactrum soli TaxID=2448455 RepID=A0A2P9HJW2_9HYPH|nr:hypothetical protein [[Ochrobactrum] soli]SPL64416.1 hypothetical protein OHAE_283 [[Ochrobactrum] soli]